MATTKVADKATETKAGSESPKRPRRTTKVTDDELVAMSGLVPPAWMYEDYVPRNLGSFTDLELLAAAHEDLDNVLIYGPTGTGKTSCVLAYAAWKQIPFYSVPSGMAERRHLFGGLVPVEGVSGAPLQWVDGPVTKLYRHGGVLLINEINFMQPKVGNTLFEGLDKRRTITLLEHRGEKIVGSEKLLVVADFNPDYEGTRPLNVALRNRFKYQEFFDYDDEVERKLFPDSPSLANLGSMLRKSLKDGTIETPISTNMLIEFEDIVMKMGLDYAIRNFVNHFNLDEQEPVKNVVKLVQAALETDYYGNTELDNDDDDFLDGEEPDEDS